MSRTLPLEPTLKQFLAYKVIDERPDVICLLFGGGAGGGKSWLGCEWIIRECMRFDDVRFGIFRKELTKLKRTTLSTFFKVAKSLKVKIGVDFIYNAQSNTILFPMTGSEVILMELIKKPSDPLFEDLGSLELTGAFVDEAGQIDELAFEVLKTRIGRWSNDRWKIAKKLLLTCNPTKSWLYKEFYRPKKEGTLIPEYEFIQSLAIDNPKIESRYVETLKAIKDKNTRERLLNGNWEYDDDPTVLMDYETILDLFTNKGEEGDKYVSCDVARFGEDKTVIAYWEGLRCVKIKRYEKLGTDEVVALLDKICLEYGVRRSHCIVDEDGIGGGVVDHFKGCKGFVNNASPIKIPRIKEVHNYANLKTQCYFKFSQLAKDGKIGIAEIGIQEQKDLIEELGQVKQKDIDKDGKIALIGKDIIKNNIGRSPDIADALMMRMYFELKPSVILKPFFVN